MVFPERFYHSITTVVLSIIRIQCNLYTKTTLGTNKLWSLYTGGLYMLVQKHGKYTPRGHVNCSIYKQVVFVYRLSLEQVWLYMYKPRPYLCPHLCQAVDSPVVCGQGGFVILQGTAVDLGDTGLDVVSTCAEGPGNDGYHIYNLSPRYEQFYGDHQRPFSPCQTYSPPIVPFSQ